jgi:hypothetical protein
MSGNSSSPASVRVEQGPASVDRFDHTGKLEFLETLGQQSAKAAVDRQHC